MKNEEGAKMSRAPARVWSVDTYWSTPDILVDGKKFCDAGDCEKIVKELNRLERKIRRLENR